MKKFLDFSACKSVTSAYGDDQLVPLGPKAKQALGDKKIFEKVAQGFKAANHPHVYFFTSYAECYSALMWHLVFKEAALTGKNQILCEAIGSRQSLEFAKAFKSFQMMSCMISPTKQGIVSYEHLVSKLGPKALCFTHRLLHPVLGTICTETARIANTLKEQNVLYHIDISHALGESFMDLEALDADFISCDLSSISKELLGAVMFSKSPISFTLTQPMTPHSNFLESFLESLETLHDKASSAMLKKITLKMQFVNTLQSMIPEITLPIIPETEALSYKLVTFPKVHQDALNFFLMGQKACIELGGGFELPLNTLLEMCFFTPDVASSSVSVYFDESMTSEDVEKLCQRLKSCYDLLLKGAL